MTGRRGRRRRKLLDDLKERRGYCQLKEEALDRTMWRGDFGRGFGPVLRQTTEYIYIYILKANWIGHILRRNCLLQRVIEGKTHGGTRSDRKMRKKT